MDAAELARRLRDETGVIAEGDQGGHIVRIPVDTGIRLLDFLLSSTGDEQASALVTRLAESDCHVPYESFCYFCGADIDGLLVAARPHHDDCLWRLAVAWKEEWA
jgi:hypothetical protein